MIRSSLIGILFLLIIPTNAHAGSSEIQSIKDICSDAPQWLVTLDKNDPLWLTKNLVNSNINDWEVASYTEKMATLALYLISYEYEKDSTTTEGDQDRKFGYRCTGIVEIMDQEIGRHYLPEDFPVWELVSQLIELDNLMARISLPEKTLKIDRKLKF